MSPCLFAFFRWKVFKTWGFLSPSLGSAHLGGSSPTWHHSSGFGVSQGNARMFLVEEPRPMSVPYVHKAQWLVRGCGRVSFRECQELKERPPGNTQQRARPHFLETSSVIPLGHPSQRTGEVGFHCEGLGWAWPLLPPLSPAPVVT